MSKVNIAVSHNLGKEEAKAKIKTMLSNVKSRYADEASSVEENWNGDNLNLTGNIKGFAISAVAEVTDNEVKFEGGVPMLATPFKGTIESTIRKQLEDALKS